jgi:hypothetical protein
MNFTFKNEEFDKLFKTVQKEVKSYIEENEIELEKGVSAENLVMWQMNRVGEYLVHPSDICPKDLENQVLAIITRHNPTL